MLNLSDKELDRLSKEAAQEYEPGDVLGPNAWEKLEMRLDSDLGRVSPNPLRHIRRFPFYYAPALLVLLGVSYFYLSKHPPSAHSLVKNSSTDQTQKYPANSTPQPNASDNRTDVAAAPVRGGAPARVGASASSVTNGATAAGGNASGSSGATGATAAAGGISASSYAGRSAGPFGNHGSGTGRNHRLKDQGRDWARGAGNNGTSSVEKNGVRDGGSDGSESTDSNRSGGAVKDGRTAATSDERELFRSTLPGLRPTKDPGIISDSALKAFTLKSMPPGIRRNALYIKRNWQFGIVAAPDFASVHSLAGDKPGSTIGLTVDYQLAPRWYISSGLLLDRRNYAEDAQSFHAPMSWYSSANINPGHVDFVKGSFGMLELPLNLRYDFSITGNTLFFASAGVSSYLFAHENGNCYVNWYGQEVPKGFSPHTSDNYLFSAANLSLGVETGLSNSLSILIAPYMKMPLKPIGLGQVQMSSVGISFSVKWAPVTSRKRR